MEKRMETTKLKHIITVPVQGSGFKVQGLEQMGN